jgi:hypothetical protein
MTLEIKARDVNVEEIMEAIRKRIEEKKRGLYTEEEIREITAHHLEPVLDAHELRSNLLDDFQANPGRWNFEFNPDTLYHSSRGALGQLLEAIRNLLRPVQKLFWNPNPMIAALSRQSDLNRSYVHLLHNLILELTRLSLEVQELKSRNLQLQARLESLVRREKTLEGMVVYKDKDKEAAPGGRGGESR